MDAQGKIQAEIPYQHNWQFVDGDLGSKNPLAPLPGSLRLQLKVKSTPAMEMVILEKEAKLESGKLSLISGPRPGLPPAVVRDPDCEARGFALEDAESSVPPLFGQPSLYMGMSCRDAGKGSTRVVISGSNEDTFQSLDFGALPKIERAHAFAVTAPDTEVAKKIGSFRWSGRTFNLMARPASRPPFSVSAGLGLSFFNYSQQPLGTKLSQFGVTLKVGTAYRFLKDRLEASLSGFGTLAQFAASDPSLPTARFIGLNGRLGYRFPKPLLNTFRFMPSLGFYAWKMVVPDMAYGISLLSGPQIFLSFSRADVTARELGFYFKFAPLLNGFSVKPDGYEVAVGSNVQVSPLRWRHRVSATVDLSHLSGELGPNSGTLQTVSAGLSWSY